MINDNFVKVSFELDRDGWHGAAWEGIWAIPEPSLGMAAYTIMNSPFFSREVSLMDIVEANFNKDIMSLEFARTIESSGNSTYMLLIEIQGEKFDRLWSALETLGCTYESTKEFASGEGRILYSVNIPAASDIYAAYQIFEEGQRSYVWEFQEGKVGHKLRI